MATVKAQRRPRAFKASNRSALDGMLMDDAHPHLWLTEDNQDISFRQLLRCIRRKRYLSEISIYNIHSKFSRRKFLQLYDTVAEFPHLENFNVWSAQPLTASIIANFLQKAKKLEQAAFNNIEICSVEDLTLLSNSVLHHPKLKRLSLDNLQITREDVDLDPLLKAVSRNPKMDSLKISTDNADTSIIANPDSLACLCNAANLKELFLWGIKLRDEDAIQMARALGDPDRSNIKVLGLRKCGNSLSNRGYGAVAEMLNRNFQLNAIYLDRSVDPNIQWRIDFYLYLNKSGTRKTLLEDPNKSKRSDWVEALASHSNDLNAIFYLLEESGSTVFIS